MSYTPEVLAVWCSTCQAQAGFKCSFLSEILGKIREAREPHPSRVNYARRAAKRRKP